MASREEYDGW